MDDTKITPINLEFIKAEGYHMGITEAATICRGLAIAEKERVDVECDCDGTGDYSGFHFFKEGERQILALIREEPST